MTDIATTDNRTDDRADDHEITIKAIHDHVALARAARSNRWPVPKYEGPSLKDFDFTAIDIEGANFSWLDLSGSNFTGMKLKNINFSGSTLRGCKFVRSRINDVDFTDTNLWQSNFQDAWITTSSFNRADLTRASLIHSAFELCTLKEVMFSHAQFDQGRMLNCTLPRCNFAHTVVRNWIVTYCDLSHSNFFDGSLHNCQFTNCNLIGAEFVGTGIDDLSLYASDLTGATLQNASVLGICLTQAKGIFMVGPIGGHRRTIFGVRHGDEVMIQAGCLWAKAQVVKRSIEEEYRPDLHKGRYVDVYLKAIDLIVATLLIKD